jgi:hypothetical protein
MISVVLLQTVCHVLVLQVCIVSAQNLRRSKAAKISKPVGWVSRPVSDSIPSSASDESTFPDFETDGTVTASTAPGLVQFAMDDVLIATMPTTQSPGISLASTDDDIQIATLPTEVSIATLPTTSSPGLSTSSLDDDLLPDVSVEIPIKCNIDSECPNDSYVCLDGSQGNCFFPPCGRCESTAVTNNAVQCELI